jgi:hypothetical protein
MVTRLHAPCCLGGGVIDKLELRVPSGAIYTPEFGHKYSELRTGQGKDPFHGTRHYAAVADLRPYGYDVVLHAHCKHGKQGNHKLELLETGHKSLTQLIGEITGIFAVEPMQLETMRVDLTADVVGVPVSFFQDTLRAAYKQVANDIEKADQFVRMGRGEIQTLYLGSRPNCFRIYNKIVELKRRYAALKRNESQEQPLPSFEEMYGYPSEGFVLTRVERQYGGGRIPVELSTLRALKENALAFDPFSSLEFITGDQPVPSPDAYDLMKFLAGLGLRQVIREQGMQRARRFVNKQSRGNAARMLRELGDFLPSDRADFALPDLTKQYRESVQRQLEV